MHYFKTRNIMFSRGYADVFFIVLLLLYRTQCWSWGGYWKQEKRERVSNHSAFRGRLLNGNKFMSQLKCETQLNKAFLPASWYQTIARPAGDESANLSDKHKCCLWSFIMEMTTVISFYFLCAESLRCRRPHRGSVCPVIALWLKLWHTVTRFEQPSQHWAG